LNFSFSSGDAPASNAGAAGWYYHYVISVTSRLYHRKWHQDKPYTTSEKAVFCAHCNVIFPLSSELQGIHTGMVCISHYVILWDQSS